VLGQLAQQAGDRIEIMAGAGVNAQNAAVLQAAGVHALHLSGKRIEASLMAFRQPAVSMASAALGEYERVEADARAIQAVIDQIQIVLITLNLDKTLTLNPTFSCILNLAYLTI